ncbi:hypothetical protein [Arenibaculum pallidiluteum]|uniref:hypothetical protein n=1 Tax=Arenibaculum pallidiluteum TaxID=2812559 RepID=UPI001A95C195|nr:hypothetical protein [Arenibaculum pallidiluteum]
MKTGHLERIANELLREHGPSALSHAQHWADKAAREDQRSAAMFWRRIAAIVLTRLAQEDDFRRGTAAVVNVTSAGAANDAGAPPRD